MTEGYTTTCGTPRLAGAIGELIPGFRVTTWFALLATAGTPAAVIERLNRDANDALRVAQVSEALAGQGIVPAPPAL